MTPAQTRRGAQRRQPPHEDRLNLAPVAPSIAPSLVQPTGDAPDHCLGKAELARYLGISRRSIDRAIAAGLLPAPDLTVGNQRRSGARHHQEMATNPAGFAGERRLPPWQVWILIGFAGCDERQVSLDFDHLSRHRP